ncbi:MAG: hypothetical protein QXQ66_00190 [Candidatus Hadarchaeum sp.]|uniref:hypothetical protein n=1 Tax=Candidatus Hadarchaeum sp. TaxID=2883567 RepID=UPI00316E8AA4
MKYAVKTVIETQWHLVLPLPDEIVSRCGVFKGQEFKIGAFRKDGQVVIIAKSLPFKGDRRV